MYEPVSHSQIHFDVMRMACERRISESTITYSRTPELVFRQMGEDLAAAIEAKLTVFVASQVEDTRQLASRDVEGFEEVPVSWWDAFKLDKFPAWALKRWPAVYRQIPTYTTENYECEVTRVCTHLVPETSRCVDFMMRDEPGWFHRELNRDPIEDWKRDHDRRLGL